MRVLLKEFRSKLNDNKVIRDFECRKGLNIEEVINIYNNYIYTIIKNQIINQEDIEEILSDVFVILWNNYDRLEKNTKVKPYLIGVTKNLIKKKYRKYNAEKNIENIEDIEKEIDNKYDISKLVENSEKSKIISNIQNNMKKEEREIFIMFYYQNIKIKDIAKNLEISAPKVKVILHRVRNKIKKEFKERGYSYGK